MNAATVPRLVLRPHAAPLLAGAALVSGCVALGLIDPTGGPPLCPFKAMTGLDCPGCGTTRAAHQLLNGNVMAALDLNVLAIVVLPLLAWWGFVALTRAFGGPAWRTPTPSRLGALAAVVAVALFGVLRNLPVAPFNWLGTA